MPRNFGKVSLDSIMFEARWILYPINIGLLIASIVYLGRFLYATWELVYHAGALVFGVETDERLMVLIVKLIEQAMTESLLILILMAGHQIYIRRFKKRSGPEWLEHIDTITMKVKVSLAFVGYSSAKLMEDIITDGVTTEQWFRHIVTHSVFLFTTLIIAIVWRVMNSTYGNVRTEDDRPQ